MIESTTDRLANWIHRNASQDNPVSKEVLAYALTIYVNSLAIGSVTLAIGFLAGKLLDSAVLLIAFCLLRAFSGGYHFKTATSCFFFSVAAFSAILAIPAPQQWLQYVLLSLCFLIVLKYAPNTANDRIEGNKLQPYMKWISLGIVSLNFAFPSWVVTLAFLVQCLSLIPTRRR